MESYEFERRKYPHPRSPEALKIRAQMWGHCQWLKNGIGLPNYKNVRLGDRNLNNQISQILDLE